MRRYANTFHNPKNPGSLAEISTDAIPVQYKGHEIFHRIKSTTKGGDIFDVVKDGKCIGMYAGINGAKKFVDQLTAQL